MADTVELPVQRRPRHTEPATVKRPKENLVAYLFLAPWFAGLLLLTAGPILASLYLSFTDFDLLTAPRWTGVDNYRRFASDPHFHNALRVTFVYVFVSVPLVVASALVVAVLLSGRRRGSGAYRSAYYLPSLLGGSVAVTVPLMTPLIFFNLVLQTINSFKAFTPAFIISGGHGGPADATLFYTLYLYQEGFAHFRIG